MHILYAELQLQFVGDGDFEAKSTTGGQTTDNTVVIGQKVHAKVETSDKVFLDNTYGVEWAYPSGGNAIRDYITTDTEGRVVELSEVYFNNGAGTYYTDDFVFYYTSNNANKLGGLNATFNLRDVNGKTYYKTAGASYYVDAPTVVSFTSMFAGEIAELLSNDGEPTIDIRSKDGNPWLQFGLIDDPQAPEPIPGIMWFANVTPSPYAGGQIAYVQLENTVKEYVLDNGMHIARSTQGQYYLDNNFPYYSGSVNSQLINGDSPGMQLDYSNEMFTPVLAKANDQFQTYLMYQPSGNDSIWVSLSMLTWYWKATAEKQANGTWEVWVPLNDYDNTTRSDTSVLPVWSGNVKNLSEWHFHLCCYVESVMAARTW